jgi:uncharacterized protein (DUF1697 family)
VTTLAEALRHDVTVVTFNMGEDRKLNEDQPLPQQPAAEEVVELADMTDEQKRIVEAGQSIAGSFPQGQPKETLSAWIMKRFITK